MLDNVGQRNGLEDVVINVFSRWEWLTLEDSSLAWTQCSYFNILQLSNMTLAVGYPERLLNPAVIDSYYDGYTIFIKDFFKNLQVFMY